MASSLLQRENALLSGQKRILEMVATAAPLTDTLAELVRFIEVQEQGLRCAVVIVSEDGAHFRRGVGPSLPEAYHRALDGLPITPPYFGACCEAAHRGVVVNVPDVAHDDRWADAWRDLRLSCGLAAVRSTPVRAAGGRVVASFAVYYDHPRDPAPADPELIEIATHLAGIAIAGHRAAGQLRKFNEKLEAGEQQFRELLDALPAAVYTTDGAGRLTYYNQAAVDLAGRRPELGRDEWCINWRLRWPDGRPMRLDECPMAIALKEDRPIRGAEAIGERPDGRLVPFAAYPTPLHDASGRMTGAVNMLVDISDRKRAAVQEQRILSIVEQSDDAIVSKDLNGIITSWNRGAERLFGYTAEEVVGKSVTILMPPDRVDEEPVILESIRRGDRIEHYETVRQRKDGGRIDISLTVSPVRDAEGRIFGASKIARDITDRKRTEEALRAGEERLRHLNEHLAQQVREEVAAREAAQTKLAHMQRMEALGQLAGGIAHDFNNILQAVQGGSALIERRPGDADGVRRLARMVMEAANRGAGITRRLLALSRRSDLRAETIDATELLADMREILAHTLGAGIEVRLQVAQALPLLLADKGQLETVLVNLGTNARDAMPEGGTLTFAAVAETVPDGNDHPADLKPGRYVRLSVTDTGTGMDAATLARIAEPFFTTKPPGKGTGLGLAMAAGFAGQSGGGLHIDSAPGRGTTVMLWLPEIEAASVAAETERRLPEAGEVRARLLLVDDDPIVLETMAEQLEAADYAILPAASATVALALLDAGEAVDLVISDLSMPGIGGVALIKEAQRRRPGLPAILLTGFASNAAEIAVGGALSGSFSLLRKPIEGGHLAERVAMLLDTTAKRPTGMRA